jgi:hypothetical protein
MSFATATGMDLRFENQFATRIFRFDRIRDRFGFGRGGRLFAVLRSDAVCVG